MTADCPHASSIDEDEIVEQYEMGYSLNAIGEYTGLHTQVVRYIVERHGGTIRSSGESARLMTKLEKPYTRKEYLTEAFADGDTYTDVAERFDVARDTVKDWACRLGVENRPNRMGFTGSREQLMERYPNAFRNPRGR